MNEEDAIEEHNGVYGNKWHITTQEGFDLPEGLEYFKNCFKIMNYGKNFIYIPTVVISNMELKSISKLKKVASDYSCIFRNYKLRFK